MSPITDAVDAVPPPGITWLNGLQRPSRSAAAIWGRPAPVTCIDDR